MLHYRTPQELISAYENGLNAWQFNQATMDALFAAGKATRFGDAAPHLAGVGAGKRALLWRSREKFDPGAFGEESQTTGDCVSHGARSARDITRSVEIDIKHEAEEYYLRSATEPTYGARGSGGQGMDPARAAEFDVDVGFLFRQKYPFADLSVYNSRIGTGWGSRGVPAAVQAECKKHHVGRWISPKTADEGKDLLYSGYGMHSGQNIGFRTTSDERGITLPSGRWSHDMCTAGFDDTREFYPVGVFMIVNSWAQWNQPPKRWPVDLYGPWIPGLFVITEEIYAQYFVGSGSIFAYADVVGVPQKKLPDYGSLSHILG